jgi:hypothetical protein
VDTGVEIQGGSPLVGKEGAENTGYVGSQQAVSQNNTLRKSWFIEIIILHCVLTLILLRSLPSCVRSVYPRYL